MYVGSSVGFAGGVSQERPPVVSSIIVALALNPPSPHADHFPILDMNIGMDDACLSHLVLACEKLGWSIGSRLETEEAVYLPKSSSEMQSRPVG